MRWGKIWLATALSLILVLAVGCGGTKLNSEGQGTRQLQPGGQLVYGSLREPNTLNPLLSDLLATAEVGSLIFSGLITVNDKGEWVPDLAVEVPTVQNGGVSPDGLTVIYKLRQGVTWHDGQPFTAADIQFTWQYIMNRKVNVISRDGYDRIKAIETPDPYTAVIRFKQPYAPYLTLFRTVLPKHILEGVEDYNKAGFNRRPVGTGPFKFKEWRLAEAIILEANPAYYHGKPHLDSIIYKIIPDPDILLTQLKAGEVDIVSNVSFAQLEQVKAIDGVQTFITPNMIWEHLDFNLDNPLFQDVRVRQAIALAIDRQSIITTVLKNVASPAVADQPPLSWAYNPALKPPARDVNKARELLAQAGWKQGPDGVFAKDGQRLAFSLVTTGGNKIRETVGQVIIQQLKEVGIQGELRLVDAPLFFGDVLKNRRFETAMYAWVAGLDPDNQSLWHSKKIPSRANGYEGQNYPGWRNPEVDVLTEQGASTLDLGSRRQIYFRLQELIVQEVPVVPLYFRANIDAVKSRVVNYRPNPTPAGNLWNAWEWALVAK
ncbi:peptide ABC transporter substrate-binding protein [Sporolituus thermophilus]|uniref:Peptide/nickel transport system substrate-binding protein n=1 Tax=Sporolituus thermophilus DSM 23256 TaxID=1123285 RepID=A0A1G7LG50_9FIRM|nr:peptide ABC transporter substrate-binding protein [Sporolituus thermophilus]SDF48356.1 peptide/nickel transport system substrate-binding protein [Sporolituus thermophilus DSM 23256]